MQIFVRVGGKTRSLDVAEGEGVASVKGKIQAMAGIPCASQRLTFQGKDLGEGESLAGLAADATLFVYARKSEDTLALTIKPRIQREQWSLYWRESMATKTEILDDFEVEVPASVTVAELKAKVAEALGWPPVGSLLRLEGFTDSWEHALFRGKELSDSATLEDCGIQEDAEVTTVRTFLAAEGWRLVGEDGEDSSDTDEEDF